MKCEVRNCVNQDHQGNGIFFLPYWEADDSISRTGKIWFCAPCWRTIVGAEISKYSQIYRNIIEHKGD